MPEICTLASSMQTRSRLSIKTRYDAIFPMPYKAYKAIFDEMCEQHFTGNDKTKSLEGRALLLALKNVPHLKCSAIVTILL